MGNDCCIFHTRLFICFFFVKNLPLAICCMLISESCDLNLENNPTGNNKNIISILVYQKEHVVSLVLSIQCTFSHLFE